MKIYLRDRNDDMAAAWTKHFQDVAEVEISSGDILGVGADAIISGTNSFGLGRHLRAAPTHAALMARCRA